MEPQSAEASASSRRASTPVALGVMAGIAAVVVTVVMVGIRLLPVSGAEPDVVGVLTAGEAVRGVVGGRPDEYVFTGAAGDEVTLTLRSRGGDLDPFLRLLEPTGSQLAEDDDSGGNLDSRITTTLAQDGEHRVQAGGLSNSSRGPYELLLTVRTKG